VVEWWRRRAKQFFASPHHSNTPSLHPANFESSQQPFRQFAGLVLRIGWFIRGSIPQSADDRSKAMRMGATPQTVRGSEAGAAMRNLDAALRERASVSPAADRWFPAAGSYLNLEASEDNEAF